MENTRLSPRSGRGGFGITYLAEQTMLERQVAIKEFFMKYYCERDGDTSHVTAGTAAGRETVARYREKFLKEARKIGSLNHPNIVRIIDVFEENGTAYYVMDYCTGGSLADMVKRLGYLPEPAATRYVVQVAQALDYIHRRNMIHLDVKPANVMLSEKDDAVLIDFGLSKQYTADGLQSSTNPVGISEGYAPMEQYNQGGVGEFSPETDIYALGATLFKLLTGDTPPSASDVNEDGVPVDELEARGISRQAISVICHAMQTRKRDRISTARAFINALQPAPQPTDQDEADVTVVDPARKPGGAEPKPGVPKKPRKRKTLIKKIISIAKKWLIRTAKKRPGILVAAAVVMIVAIAAISNMTSRGVVSASYGNGVLTVNGVTYEMAPVEGGTFTMGATPEMTVPFSYERPTHQVTLSGFSIGKTEVTQALWKAVMGSNPSEFKGDNRPVENVSWDDCQEFISKLNSYTGMTFRLPTEAEWEFAARGGNNSKHTQYSGSSNIDDVAWYGDNSGSSTHDVATKSPNELGLYDMSGNVLEWCQDWYGDYSGDAQTSPTGPSEGSYRVTRGGSWYYRARYCRVSRRSIRTPANRYNFLGLRLAL